MAHREEYEPLLPTVGWERIRGFVLDVVRDVGSRVPYEEPAIINAVAYHVDWCANLAGFALDREEIFCRDVIGAAVAVMPTVRTSSKGRRRSILFRVGEALDVIPVAPTLPTLSAAIASAPYSELEQDHVLHWALTQPARDEQSARVLVALGLGAGLASREIAQVRGKDILNEGGLVRTTGPASRIVPLSGRWGDELCILAASTTDPNAPLFRPQASRSKNVVTNFVNRSLDAGERPTTQRMRASWLVDHLSTGTPMQDLLSIAGLTSMDALVRYEKFLPRAAVHVQLGT